MTRPWDDPNWWGWKRKVCIACGRMTFRPPASKRRCDCGGPLNLGVPIREPQREAA